MSKQAPHTVTIFVDHGDTRRKPVAAGKGPHVGIWWAEGKRIAAMLQAGAKVRTREPLVDSDLDHWRQWPAVAGHFVRSKSDNYFDVPRGRVLLNRATGSGVIYHGNETEQDALQEIAKLYELPQWDSHVDEHYLMGAEIDDLFDDELG
jgi:hypothetical protein